MLARVPYPLHVGGQSDRLWKGSYMAKARKRKQTGSRQQEPKSGIEHRTTSTGIYTKTTVESGPRAADQRLIFSEFLNKAESTTSLEWQLDAIEKWAREVLKRHGIQELREKQTKIMQRLRLPPGANGGPEFDRSDDQKSMANKDLLQISRLRAEIGRQQEAHPDIQDAEEALLRTVSIRKLVAKGDVRGAAAEGLRLGILFERGKIRFYEPMIRLAKSGRSTTRGSQEMLHCVNDVWLKLSSIQHRLAAFMDGRSEASIQELYQDIWGRPFAESARSRVKMAISELNKKFADHDPPVRAALHIKRDQITVSSPRLK